MDIHTFTGPQGSGKTTKANALADKLTRQGRKPYVADIDQSTDEEQSFTKDALRRSGYTDLILTSINPINLKKVK